MNKNEIGTEWSTWCMYGWSYCERGNEYNNTCSPKLKKFNKSIEKKTVKWNLNASTEQNIVSYCKHSGKGDCSVWLSMKII